MKTRIINKLSYLQICIFTFITLGIIGCAQGPADDGKPMIAVIPKGTTHIFWQSVHAGAKAAAKDYDVNVEWNGPPTETQKDIQVSIVQDFIVRQVDGIVLAPQDKDALSPVAEDVQEAGIPLVIFDSGLESDAYLSFVATDNYKGGVEAAHAMAREFEKKGANPDNRKTVIIVKVDPGSESTNERERGFEETMAEDYPDIEIIDSQYGYSDREKSRAAAEDLLSKYPDVDAVFGPNESSAFGALLALQSRGMAGEKIFIGFDSSDDLVEALRDGEIQALVLQNPYQMGYQSVETLVKHLNGEEVKDRVDTGVYVITKENMDEPENQKLLNPDLSILQEG